MKKTVLCILILTVATWFSCNKKDEDSTASKLGNLTNGSWKMSGYMTDYEKDGVYEENTYTILADCEKDNIYTFLSNGALSKDEGPSKCIESNPQTTTSTWSLQDNGNYLLWGGSKYTIEELSTGTLKLKQRTTYNAIYTIDIKLTYSKQ